MKALANFSELCSNCAKAKPAERVEQPQGSTFACLKVVKWECALSLNLSLPMPTNVLALVLCASEILCSPETNKGVLNEVRGALCNAFF